MDGIEEALQAAFGSLRHGNKKEVARPLLAVRVE
jgi:hypothetical protein